MSDNSPSQDGGVLQETTANFVTDQKQLEAVAHARAFHGAAVLKH
jgi:hypothetical protein